MGPNNTNNNTVSDETDPLLVLPTKTASTVRKNTRKNQKKNRCLLCIAMGGLAMVVGSMVAIKNNTASSSSSENNNNTASPASVLGRAKSAKSMVRYSPSKAEYTVDWNNSKNNSNNNNNNNSIIAPSTTFAELAKIMLLPWYEASMMAVLDDPAWNSKDGIAPTNVRPIRRSLLIARDMLDVFSPVFPDTLDPTGFQKKKNGKYRKGPTTASKKKKKKNKGKDRSLWKELRTMYRHGYQLTGELHDLKGLAYSTELLDERVDVVLKWKKEFLAFNKAHEIRRYLYQDFGDESLGGIDPNGCYYHKASHLFWADSTRETLPCGNNPGPQSLRALASVQLTHSLTFLNTIQNYTTVMPRDHEINFHNLRKELRIFVDEYNLFGNVLFPEGDGDGSDTDTDSSAADDDFKNYDDEYGTKDAVVVDENDDVVVAPPLTLREKIDFLDTTQSKLGNINDHWTAHDVYGRDNNSHAAKQKKLAKKTDSLWADWLEWQAKHDLKGIMEEVLEQMNSGAQ